MNQFKNSERLEEGWVSFIRYYCKEGYIDKWMGDSINNPNNPKKHQMCLNSSLMFYRLNDSKWVVKYDVQRGLNSNINNPEIRELFTAEENLE